MRLEMLESWVRQTANRFGIDIKRHRPSSSETGYISRLIESGGVDLVLDVGANTGQFARSLRHAGYQGRMVSFEPLESAHADLLVASAEDMEWSIAPRVAIGDHEGTIEVHVAGNSVSSSILGMLDAHSGAAPESVYVGKQQARLSTLDEMTKEYVASCTAVFVKIDTQGYEDRVLDGATAVLTKTAGLQLELSLVPLYEGQQLFDDLTERLRNLGFSIWSIYPGLRDSGTGRLLQVDATFARA